MLGASLGPRDLQFKDKAASTTQAGNTYTQASKTARWFLHIVVSRVTFLLLLGN